MLVNLAPLRSNHSDQLSSGLSKCTTHQFLDTLFFHPMAELFPPLWCWLQQTADAFTNAPRIRSATIPGRTLWNSTDPVEPPRDACDVLKHGHRIMRQPKLSLHLEAVSLRALPFFQPKKHILCVSMWFSFRKVQAAGFCFHVPLQNLNFGPSCRHGS